MENKLVKRFNRQYMILLYNEFSFNLTQPIDISISMHSGFGQVNAWYAPPFRVSPVKMGDFVGSTKLGGSVNFMNFQCNPHGKTTLKLLTKK